MRARTIEPTAQEAARRDPIEDEGWFQAFPEAHRERILTERALEREQDAEVELLERRRLLGVIREGAIAFGAVELLLAGFGWQAFLAFPVVGAGVGALWVVLRTGILLSTLIAMPAFMVAQMLFGSGSGHSTYLGLVAGSLIIGCLSAYLGSRREVRSYE